MRVEADLHVETAYRILWEDDHFLVVDKPAPLPVHAVGRFREKNLLSFLIRDLRPGGEGLRVVNRLDSETSGLVLVAKSAAIAGKLGILFENRQVEKEYHAVVMGMPQERKGSITMPLGLKVESGHNIRTHDPDGESAQTDYEVLEGNRDHSFIKIMPRTGRTHQIRAHLALLGHPIVGDKIYIDPAVFERYIHEGWLEEMRPVVGFERLLLHASGLAFCHPVTGRSVKYASEIPSCFNAFLNKGKSE